MRKQHPGLIIMLAAMALTTAPCPAADDSALSQHMNRLTALLTCWRDAAGLLHDGEPQQAYQRYLSLRFELPGKCPWRLQHIQVGHLFKAHAASGRPLDSADLNTAYQMAMLGRSDLAAESFAAYQSYQAIDPNRRGPINHDQRTIWGLCLLELGQANEARRQFEIVRRDLPETNPIIRKRLERAIAMCGDGHEPTITAEDRLLLCNEMNIYRRLSPIVALWQDESIDMLGRARILREVFAAIEDRPGEQAAARFIADAPQTPGQEAADALLAMAKRLPPGEAIGVYQRVEREHPDTAAWYKAVFGHGRSLEKLGHYQAAIEQYQRLLQHDENEPDEPVDMRLVRRGYCHDAQWQIGECLLAMGNYRAAQAAYRLAETRYPFDNGCGNCAASVGARRIMRLALCSEHLGEYDQAVWHYVDLALGIGIAFDPDPAPSIRLVDLYEAAGQLDDLHAIVAAFHVKAITEITMRRFIEKRDEKETRRMIDHAAEPYPVETIMTIRAWGRTGQWDKLLEVLTRDDSGGRPHEASGRNSNWMAVEAAQALTAAPDQTVGPLMKLLSETDKRQPLRSMWVCYALALTQTEQAAAALKTRLAQSQNWYVTCDYVYMLSLAGEPGRRVLDELAPKSHSSQADAIERLAAGKLDVTAIAEPPLPPIPAGLTLPGAR